MLQFGLNIAHGQGLRQGYVALFALPVLGLLNRHGPKMRMQYMKARHETDIIHIPLVEFPPREIARFEQAIHIGSENNSDKLKRPRVVNLPNLICWYQFWVSFSQRMDV